MAITGMAVQGCLYGTPVVKQTPWFLKHLSRAITSRE